jgi:hypothetical protein
VETNRRDFLRPWLVVCQRGRPVIFSGLMPKKEGRLPNFIIVGATKAGTTSLDVFLSLHREIHMARPKESRFFIDAQEPMVCLWRKS